MTDISGLGLLPPPTAFGAPEKFGQWRAHQMEAVLSALNSKERFLVQVQPTGSGKSLCYVMAAVLSGKRVLILTSTKALQDQVMADFGTAFNIADVRGQAAYQCLADTNVTVEDGPCHYGWECSLKESGCYHYDAVRRAKRSQIVLSNYAYWMSGARVADSLGRFDVLALDEAHDNPEWVMKMVSASISEQICKDLGGVMPDGDDAGVWKRWASGMAGKVELRAKEVAAQIKNHGKTTTLVGLAGRLRKYDRALGNMLMIEPVNMVVDRETVGGHALIEPISAAGLAEKLLFRGTEQVILTSATIRAKTLHMMGVVDGDRMRIEEYPSQFAASRRPVVYVPTVRVQHDMTVESERRWAAQIDNIVRQRRDRKGIIHSVSYQRARRIAQLSEFRDDMIVHDSWTLNKAIQTFRESGAGKILVSPSISTGYDFPYEQAEYQIISKVPFPDSRAAAIKARMKHDPEYGYYVTMQQVVQASGRGMRSGDDRCEVFVVDDNWGWFVGRWRRFAPKWFLEACVTRGTIPRPPEKMERG